MSVITKEEHLRFSGHDTFHCREQWILKGLQLIEKQGNTEIFKSNSAISELGVGKNMVRSIYHWLKAFGFLNKENEISEIANLLFIVDRLDPFLEKEGSLWLLQYLICKNKYASIYSLIFADYFSDKATLDFTESQIISHVNRKLKNKTQKAVTEKTLNSDYKVFIRTYVSPVKNEKTVEDDFNAPLLSLNLITDTGRKNSLNQPVYHLNRVDQNVPKEIFIYCLLTEFENESSINFDCLRITIGAYLCLSNESIEQLIEEICEDQKEFVYKDDAGIRQLQVKKYSSNFKNEILRSYYEN
jgi:hypothetical protein